jgi:hypothetical protein
MNAPFVRKHFHDHRDVPATNTGHLSCDTCGQEIIWPHELQEHFVEDRNTGKHGCIKCNKQYSGFMELVRHIARQHGNHGKYQCGLCQEFELQSTELTGVEHVCYSYEIQIPV